MEYLLDEHLNNYELLEEGDFVDSTGYYKTNENVQTNLAVQSKEANHQ